MVGKPPALPNELYREIVSNLEDKRHIFSLLTVSRILNYEAERILYRDISLKLYLTSDIRGLPLHSESARNRSACHVRCLRIQVLYEYSDFVESILKSTENLKMLSFTHVRGDVKTFTLPTTPPFQLLTLVTDLPGDINFRTFLQTQRKLTTMRWNPARIDSSFFPLDFLPSLKTLISSTSRIDKVLLASGVQCFVFQSRKLAENVSMLPVQSIRYLALAIQCDKLDSRLPIMFPNIEVLKLIDFCFGCGNLPVEKFAHLRKIDLTYTTQNRHQPTSYHCLTIASHLFEFHSTLRTVEVSQFRPGQAWIKQRGGEPILVDSHRLKFFNSFYWTESDETGQNIVLDIKFD